jgi:hypothetical protein
MKNKSKNKRYALGQGATVHVYYVTVSVRYLATLPFLLLFPPSFMLQSHCPDLAPRLARL